MTDQDPKKPSRLPLLILITVALVAAGAAIFFVTGGGEGAQGPPPPMELGPDTAKATADPAIGQTASLPSDPDAPPTPPTPSNDPTVATASARGSAVAFADESLSFSAAIPEGPINDPVLAYLRKDSQGYLDSIKSNARADFDRLKRAGVNGIPWEVRVNWDFTAKAGGIVSLAGEASEYSGGAHPIQRYDTLIARADTGKKIEMADMLVLKRSPSPAMMIGICEALKKAKTERIKSATIMDEPIVCAGASANAKTEDAKLALAPSNQPGKFGGVYAYYEPYAVGPYAEGSYQLTVQQEVFAEDLKPEFKALFGGRAPVLEN